MKYLLGIFSLLAICQYNLFAVKIESGPYLTNVDDTSACIVWTTDAPSVSWVEIAPDDGSHFYSKEREKFFDSPMGKKRVSTLHKINLENLESGKNYRYRIFSKEVVNTLPNGNVHYGSVASSVVYKKEALKFKTADAAAKEASFLVVNDIHADYKKLEALLKNLDSTQFLVMNGDMTSDMRDRKQIFEGYMNSVSKLTKGEIPIFMVRGNHEARGPYAENFGDYFPNSNGLPYYTFRYGPVFFVVLDCGEDKPDSDVEYTDLSNFDKYRTKQAKWMDSVVQSKEFKDAPVKILLTHIPLSDDKNFWHGSLDAKKKFAPIINKAGFDLILNGHYHRNEFFPSGSNGINVPASMNSNDEALRVTVKSGEIKLEFFNTKGEKARDDISIGM